MSEFIQVVTTTSSQVEAINIARLLVEQRLAACVQVVGPIESIYRWESKVENATEWQCTSKTVKQLFSQVEQLIQENHSYKTPEILAIPIVDGSLEYLEWLRWVVQTR